MATVKTIYKLGDLSNGDFAKYETEAEALAALEEAISEGTLFNMEAIGEEGCPWITEDDARTASEDFLYVKKVTKEFDEDGDVIDEDFEVIAGEIK